MKTRQLLPPDLSAALRSRPRLMRRWHHLEEATQRRYIIFLLTAKDLETRHRRLDQILKAAAEYYRKMHALP